MKIYNKNNFHKHTFCIFKEANSSEIEGLKTNFISKSGSSYIFTAEGVFRKSDHWGRAANCKWRLESNLSETSRTKIGFAKWTEFHPIDETEKWYYIAVDFDAKEVHYNHKNGSNQMDLCLRNATETTKRVREIRQLYKNEKKLHHWKTTLEFDQLLRLVVEFLVTTDLSLLEIRQEIS
jgi:hypothetical protein